jgi:hypothetical protein
MKNQAAIQERYLREELPQQLGGLAANLARIQSFSDHPDHREVVARLVEESLLFIEWTVPHVGAGVQAELVELQSLLAGWQQSWAELWADDEQRNAMAQQAQAWSERVLKMAGLLP